MNERLRKFLPFIVLGLVVVMFLAFAQSGERTDVGRDLSYSSFVEKVEAGEVRSVTMKGGDITGTLSGWFPMLLLIAVWIFFMRQMQSGVRQGHGLRQVQGQDADRTSGPRHFR